MRMCADREGNGSIVSRCTTPTGANAGQVPGQADWMAEASWQAGGLAGWRAGRLADRLW